MNELRKGSRPRPEAVSLLEIDEEDAGQRLDNFLVRILKGVPKSHVYRILRTGEIRVNSRRADAQYRLAAGDRVRVPPIRTARPASGVRNPPHKVLSPQVLFEDAFVLLLDKPAGMAVHGGSGISRGVIEQLRAERPELRFLELAHRLDRETSGVLMLAKKRSALTHLHAQMRDGAMDKRYLALVSGSWRNPVQHVQLPLHKYLTEDGERRVVVDEAGMPAHTVFRLRQSFADFTLLEAELKTGRTHQIRVHLAHLGYPIAGDDKYGDFALNKSLAKRGLKRMFLHACRLSFAHPDSGAPTTVEAPLARELTEFIERLRVPAAAATGGEAA